MLKTTELDHVAITVSNIEESISFYRDILNLELLIDFETDELSPFFAERNVKVRSVIFNKGGKGKGMVELLSFSNPKGEPVHLRRKPFDPGLWMLSFEVENVKEAYEELLKKKIEFTNPPSQLTVPNQGVYKVVLIKGPDGVLIELLERPENFKEI